MKVPSAAGNNGGSSFQAKTSRNPLELGLNGRCSPCLFDDWGKVRNFLGLFINYSTDISWPSTAEINRISLPLSLSFK